jgi:hypothetical protein
MKGGNMDFIEQIFGISPDGGSGALELMLFLVPILGLALLRIGRERGKSPDRKKSTTKQ